jgi:hypothetical protein
MDGAWEARGTCTALLSGNRKEGDHLEDLGVDGKYIKIVLEEL